jgi:hypothetical protein
MKSAYLLGVLACGLHIEARQVPRAGVLARQWGDGGGEGEGDWTCVWADHCLGMASRPYLRYV